MGRLTKRLSVEQVAALYGCDPSRIRHRARSMALPARYERRGQGSPSRVFTAREVEKLRPAKRGRPRKS